MNRKQERKFSMYNAVSTYLQSVDPTIIGKMPLMDEAIEALQKSIDEIRTISENQQESRKAYRQIKQATREEVENTFYLLLGQVKSLAVNTNNILLRDQVSFSLSALKGMSDGNLQVTTGIILEKANENLADLLTYGATAASLTAAQDLRTDYISKMADPRNAISYKAEETKLLKIEFAKTDKLLEDTMDTLIIIIKYSDMTVYDIYKNNRKIIGPNGMALAFRVFVKNMAQEPIQYIKAVIEGDSTTYKTSIKGSFQIKSLPDGMHSITFSKAGYQTQVIEFPITKKERTDLHVTMQPV